jgi:hypothetical protein
LSHSNWFSDNNIYRPAVRHDADVIVEYASGVEKRDLKIMCQWTSGYAYENW